jgi:pentatricopeptide repeat protein
MITYHMPHPTPTTVWGHTKRLEWAKAVQILRLMEGKGVKPDRLTYSYLIACLADCRNLEEAAGLYREMVEDKGIRPNLQLYSQAIDVYAKAGDTTRAVEVFKEMRRQRVVPNLVTFTSLMEAFVTAGYPMAALSISDEMRRNKALARDVTSYVWRIKCYVELGDLEAIEALVQEMVDEGVRPNEVAYTEYLRAAMRTAHYDLALRLLATIYDRFPRRRHGLELHEALLELPRDHLLSSSSSSSSSPPPAAAAAAQDQEQPPQQSQQQALKEKLVVFYYSALKLMAKHRVRARMTLYVAFLHAAMRAGRLDLAAEIVALRRENTLQIFKLFRKYLEVVEKWEGKVERALKGQSASASSSRRRGAASQLLQQQQQPTQAQLELEHEKSLA